MKLASGATALFLWFGIFGVNAAHSDTPSRPKGLEGTFDPLGYNKIQWVYSMWNDTTYSSAANVRLKGMYISKEPAPHQIACRFIISSPRQLVDFADVWVEKGRDYSISDWFTMASVSVGIYANGVNAPGRPLCSLGVYRPGQAGIPPEGGYLRINLATHGLIASGDTLWLVLEWPAQYPDLVWVGVDTEPPAFNAMFRVGGEQGSSWELWTLHNFMMHMVTLKYSTDCSRGNCEYMGQYDSTAAANPQGFVVARREKTPDGIKTYNPIYAVLCGDQTCFLDTAVLVDESYRYEIRSFSLSDTSEPATVTINVQSPFSCEWVPPDIPAIASGDKALPPYTFYNNERDPLRLVFLSGWLRESSLIPSGGFQETGADSLPFFAESRVMVVAGKDVGTILLHLKKGLLKSGYYELQFLCEISDFRGVHARYAQHGTMEVLEPTEVIGQEESVPKDNSGPQIWLFPNPSKDHVNIEFSFQSDGDKRSQSTAFAGDGDALGNYQVAVFNILGQEVNRISPDVTSCAAGNFRIKFNCVGKNGNQLPSGLYFVKICANGWSACRKLMITR